MHQPGNVKVPDASTTVKGKVLLAADGEVSSTKAVTGSDARVNNPIQAKDNGGSAIGTRFHHIKQGSNVTLTDDGLGNLVVSVPGGGTGPSGPTGPTGPAGPPGPGFSSFDFKTGTKTLTNDNSVHTDNFTTAAFSFTPKMAAVTITYNELAGVPSVTITGVTIVSNTVRVDYSYQTNLISPVLNFCITAAG
jgi:hypothetical protein